MFSSITPTKNSGDTRAENTDETERDTDVERSEIKSESLTPELIELRVIKTSNVKPDLAHNYNNQEKISLSDLVSENLDQILPDLKTESNHGSINLMLDKETPD